MQEPGKVDPMTISDAIPIKVGGSMRRQAPTFALIGLTGYVVDSTLTYAFVRWFGVDPVLARFPAFAIATVINFLLNRFLTFANSRVAILPAFVKYVMVCAVGFVVNYLVYLGALKLSPLLGFPVTPGMLPIFVAMGSGVAMFFTFFGFRFFAFRS